MNNLNIDGINKVSSMMELITKKQKAISTNLANMDTPNYKRQDVSFSQYLGSLNNPLETKLSKVLGPAPIMTETDGAKINAVNEILELQKNSILFTMATRNLSSTITQMKTVINVGK